jgi:hypothetical protein
MTDWHDIVDMINAFSKVFHLRHSSSGSATTYPPVPKIINPAGVKRVSESPTSIASLGPGQVQCEGAEQNTEGYTGELGVSDGSSHDDERNEVSTPLQWRDIWPEL